MYRGLLAAVLLIGCVTQTDEGPTAGEMDQADAWAETADGKADLPNTFGELVAWVRDFYRNRLSAVWGHQEHPASAAAAIARVKALVGDPTHVTFVATVQRLRFSDVADHSELDIALPGKQVVRLIGDPKGPGMYVDSKRFAETLAPALCLSWPEVETAIEASYAAGAYGADFVCHNVTERVLRALHLGSAQFSAQIHAYSIARYVWGPIVPSGNSSDLSPHACR